MEDWSRAKLCDVVNSFSVGAPRQMTSIMGLFIAVLSIARAGRLRSVGGMAQLGSRTMAHRSAMAVGRGWHCYRSISGL